MSLTRRQSPISVAKLQCCTVGVNFTLLTQALHLAQQCAEG
jgi:hypothetical protein